VASAACANIVTACKRLGSGSCPDPRNAHTHPKHRIDQLQASIQEFGFTNPILAEPDDFLIFGWTRASTCIDCAISRDKLELC
jgi:hypothetical protein